MRGPLPRIAHRRNGPAEPSCGPSNRGRFGVTLGNLCDNSFVPARGFRSPAVVVQSAHTPGAARCVTGHVQRWTLPRTGLHENIP